MRRNEENLLVLAGGEPGRWITRPVAVADLLRAAAQEIEEYQRIQITEAPAVATTAHIAGDAIHLLAELFENATSFSPPQTRVRVSAFRRPEGLLITVVDTGIGMPASRVSEANERLARPSALTSTLVGTMGLLVVARLAQRHGIRVHLQSVPAGGTTATVVLPDRAVVPITSLDLLQPARRLPSDVARASGGEGEATVPVPAPAATTMPPSLAARPVSAPPVIPGQRPPASPVPAAAAGPVHIEVEFTEAGLPRRSPDPAPPTVEDSGLPPGMPDPETVRARLSSLASGIAAANRDTAAPPSVPPPTR
jgi:anti-sigma regulatory factor (Ser/Thr protein kinase)